MKRTLGTVVALGAIVALVVSVTASGEQPAPSRHGGNQGHHGKTPERCAHWPPLARSGNAAVKPSREALSTPRSVMRPVTRRAGVTSKP